MMKDKFDYKKSAVLVLLESDIPLTVKEIHSNIEKRFLFPLRERINPASLGVYIRNDIKDREEESIFYKPANGLYSLNEKQIENYFTRVYSQNALHAPSGDRVLVVSKERLNETGKIHGIDKEYSTYINSLLRSEIPLFMDRFLAESDSNYKQIVSYLILRNDDKLLLFTRSEVNDYGSYVDGKYSIGFGGHVQDTDYDLFTSTDGDSGYIEGLKREVFEESGYLISNEELRNSFVGVLNDDSTPLGMHHIAFVHIIDINPKSSRLETDDTSINNLRFKSYDELGSIFHKLEYWSQLCLIHFFGNHLNLSTFITGDELLSENQNADLLLLVGGIGSGKTLTANILEEYFDYLRVPCSRILQELIGCPSIDIIGRETIQDLGYEFINKEHGHNLFAQSIVNWMSSNPNDKYLIDGLRYPETYRELCELLSNKIPIIYIENTIERRLEFVRSRESQKITLQYFYKILKHPVEGSIERFMPKSKVVIYNHGTLQDLKSSLIKYFREQLTENPWDVNANSRHIHVTSGLDLTFSKVFAPRIIDILKSQKEIESSTVLDVGCASGEFSVMLSSIVKNVIGIDSSAKSIELASSKNNKENIDYFHCDIKQFKSSGITDVYEFDVIIAHMLFHTTPFLNLVIERLADLLSKNGKLIFSIPHPCFFAERKRYKPQFTGYTYSKESFHKIEFTISKDDTPLPRLTPYYHRPISDYFSAIGKAGLICESCEEPFPSDEILLEYPNDGRVWDYAHGILFVCRKDQ